ncbi:2-dehydropantoate 2-reductase [Oceanospirillum multiglobuliferum]|uniref:2-dehydropantoate 2-reductase n=1 Tax=Oceanospirillum multiglobuliferum TaxID=64969 RepID=A0A1T4N5Y2_9GAMM|nr:2-dehydropantoate 2-reductase [Oceanospirillum multiglobuliferum]OPX55850.1 hypothetical protein BTE48_06525 [Oceanospirillum multiglobuliferum]SJZ74623.1 2-dehydropantoate 2-reductase [Oceanospirillum multiglobuliferum]
MTAPHQTLPLNPSTTQDSIPCWSILGAGSLGSLWAGYLSLSGYAVQLLVRRLALSDQTRSITPYQGERLSYPAQVSDIQSCADRSIQQLIVATKAPDALPALNAIRPKLADQATIVLLQNGMGAQQTIAAQFEQYAVLAACITDGAYLENSQHVIHAGKGLTRIGGLNQKGQAVEQQIAEQLQKTALQVELSQPIEQVLWNKLAINIAINGLTAVHQCLNGALAEPDKNQQVLQLCLETEKVMRALGLTVPEQGLFALANQVIAGTAANRSSMLQDTQKGQPTEIEFINGYLLRQAQHLGIDVPYNAALTAEVLQRFHQAR